MLYSEQLKMQTTNNGDSGDGGSGGGSDDDYRQRNGKFIFKTSELLAYPIAQFAQLITALLVYLIMNNKCQDIYSTYR